MMRLLLVILLYCFVEISESQIQNLSVLNNHKGFIGFLIKENNKTSFVNQGFGFRHILPSAIEMTRGIVNSALDGLSSAHDRITSGVSSRFTQGRNAFLSLIGRFVASPPTGLSSQAINKDNQLKD